MKAVVISEHGSFDVLRIEDRPKPDPKPDEVRVRVRAAALNHLDTWVRRGIPGVKFPLPLIPGCDGAGVVDLPGESAHGIEAGMECVLAPGVGHLMERNYGILGETRDGTCCEYIVVPRENIIPKPTNLSFEEAAAVPLTFLTAWAMLTRRANVRPGEWVLVHAAGSGVGTAAVQIAKLHGCNVIATASSQEKRDKALALGADHAIPYEDFSRTARRITKKAGVDVVFEHVGAATWNQSILALKKGGRLVTCGGTSGHEITFDLRHLFFKSLSFLGNTMGTLEELKTVLGLVEAGRLRPVVDTVFPLEKIQAAHQRLAERAVFGKIVVSVSGP